MLATEMAAPSGVEVALIDGRKMLVDAADYESEISYRGVAFRIESTQWRLNGKGYRYDYAMAWLRRVKIMLHRALLNAPTGVFVDHRNGNTLDNRRINLRTCTHAENNRNSRGFGRWMKGVSLDARMASRPWRAGIKYEGRQITIGYFATEIEAALAYDAKARELFGEFARLNFQQ